MNVSKQITLSKEVIKRQVEILRKELHQDIKQMVAYEIISKLYGFPDWNHFSAFLKRNKKL